MTFVIAKRGSGDSPDYHLWRQGPRILEFNDEADALVAFTELAQRFGTDALILLRRVDVSINIEVKDP
jgi:hypothetical protein